MHTALAAQVGPNDRVLVSGAGSVGLFATLALRNLTSAGEIIVVAKHGHQRELAHEFGATQVVAPAEVLRRVRRTTGAFQVKPEYSSPYLLGGVDIAVDAVGSKSSLETALHATRAGGRVVLSGMPAAADLSAAWFRELEVVGSYASAQREERADGRSAFDLATELVAGDPMSQSAKTVASYPLHRWREVLYHAHAAGRLGTVKVGSTRGDKTREPSRIRARGGRPDASSRRPRGGGFPAGGLPARYRATYHRSRRRPCPTSRRRSGRPG